jgi:hypothetical protein
MQRLRQHPSGPAIVALPLSVRAATNVLVRDEFWVLSMLDHADALDTAQRTADNKKPLRREDGTCGRAAERS